VNSFEGAVECRLINKSTLNGDVGKGQAGIRHKISGPIHTAFRQPLVRRPAKGLLKARAKWLLIIRMLLQPAGGQSCRPDEPPITLLLFASAVKRVHPEIAEPIVSRRHTSRQDDSSRHARHGPGKSSKLNMLIRAVLGTRVGHLLDQYAQHEPEVIRFGSLSLETQLPLRDFRNLSTCTISCGGLSYGHRTT
jgi:hypothetical protein